MDAFCDTNMTPVVNGRKQPTTPAPSCLWQAALMTAKRQQQAPYLAVERPDSTELSTPLTNASQMSC